MPMRFADGLGGGEAVAEAGSEIGVERGDGVRAGTAFALADGRKSFGHGVTRLPVLIEGAKVKRERARWLAPRARRIQAAAINAITRFARARAARYAA